MKIKTLLSVLALVLLAPVAAWAQTAWTGAPGAAVIDEQSVGIYDANPVDLTTTAQVLYRRSLAATT